MDKGEAVKWFREAILRHGDSLNLRKQADRELRRVKALRAHALEPVVHAIAEDMRELADMPEYATLVGSVVETLCDGTCPRAVPMEAHEIPRADAWVVTFPLHETLLDIREMPALSSLVGVRMDEDTGLLHVWVHTADSSALVESRRNGCRLPYLFETGTILATSADDARRQVVASLVDTVAFEYVNRENSDAARLS